MVRPQVGDFNGAGLPDLVTYVVVEGQEGPGKNAGEAEFCSTIVPETDFRRQGFPLQQAQGRWGRDRL